MSRILAVFFSALLFGLGLGISGMTRPSKIIGFLDVAGKWDPSLVFVMVGAIAVHSITFRLITKRKSPVLATNFKIPKSRQIDLPLILGAVLFGAGWGLGGFCPGPAIVAWASRGGSVLVFLLSMLAGIYFYHCVGKIFLAKGLVSKCR
jgi:uncharacterized membrane protein YedE/YeeE